jgi:hypothetical protein
MKEAEIHEKNMGILSRLQDVKPIYDTGRMKREALKQEKNVQMRCKFP